MKAETALIVINGRVTLKAVLIPEDEDERKFLVDALEKAENYKLSAAIGIK